MKHAFRLILSLWLGLVVSTTAIAQINNVVLVHGAAVDGSTWHDVYEELVKHGMNVKIVDLPLEGFDSDVAALRRALAQIEGPIVLVGHSYGGEVITEAGGDEKVRALVYVAALQPERGESFASLSQRFPPAGGHSKQIGLDRFIPDPAFLHADLAGDLSADTTALLAASLRPTPFSAGTSTVTFVAWKTKPTYGIVATQDRTIAPELERFMYKRSGAKMIEIPASHMVLMSHPKKVADVILEAARQEK